MATKTCAIVAETRPKKVLSLLKYGLAHSDYVELRLDFLSPTQVPYCLTLAGKNLERCVCTLRPKKQGGKFQGTEKERISILKLIADFEPYLIDVEYNTLKKDKNLHKYLKNTKTNILVSWHDFKKTPNEQTLKSTLNKMSRLSNNVKIVTYAKTLDDTIRILSLYKSAKKNTNLVSFAMGENGRMSRVLCTKLGSPYTYVSLGKPIVPGQFSLDEMKRIFSLEK